MKEKIKIKIDSYYIIALFYITNFKIPTIFVFVCKDFLIE